jgi:hypothetical protein
MFNHVIFIIDIINNYLYYFKIFQLDFQPADVKHSSLHTMANKVRRAMLPNNHAVFKKSFAEGKVQFSFCMQVHST